MENQDRKPEETEEKENSWKKENPAMMGRDPKKNQQKL